MELKRPITTMPTSKVVIFLCVVLAMTGCTGEKKAGGAISDKVYTALAWRDEALEYDKAGQMRLAEDILLLVDFKDKIQLLFQSVIHRLF